MMATGCNAEKQGKSHYEDEDCIPISEWPVQLSTTVALQIKEKSKPVKRHYKGPFCNNSQAPSTEEIKCAKLDKQNEHQDREPWASIRIARWWRKNKSTQNESFQIASKNPNTQLYHVSRTRECQDFLKQEKKCLQRKLLYCNREETMSIHAALSSIDDWLGLYDSALSHIMTALQICNTNPKYRWLKEKLSKQCNILDIQKQAIKIHDLCQPTFPEFEKVQRISCEDLSVEQFKHSFVKQHKPVIIEGVVSSMTGHDWNLDYIKTKAGEIVAPVKTQVPGSVEWAKLEEVKMLNVAEHIDNIKLGKSSDYLFDWSLPLYCPQLAEEIAVPSYFCDNFLKQTSPGSLYHDSWPSLFVAPAGIKSDLHVDAFASSFWMALFQGKKRWTFFSKEDLPYLYPIYRQSLDPCFDIDLCRPDVNKFPLLSLTKPKQCVLKPGDLLFVPSGSPHFVENLSPSVAVSSNYVDATNFDETCEELRICGLLDPMACQLYEQMQSSLFKAQVLPQMQGSSFKAQVML